MSFRTTLILFGVALAATIGVKVLEGARLARNLFGDEQVIYDSIDSLETLRIERGGETIRLERSGGKDEWLLIEPLRFPARFANVEQLLIHLRNFRIRGSGDEDLRQSYGLDAPDVKVWLGGKGGQYHWFFGKDHATEPRVYAEYGEGSAKSVILCDRTLRDAFRDVRIADLRSVALTGVKAAAVSAIVVQRPAGELRIERSGTEWRIKTPFEAFADPTDVEFFVDWTLASWVIDEFVADGPGIDWAAYGLDAPRYVVSIAMSDAKRPPVEVLIGAADPKSTDGNARVYACRRGEPHVFLIPANLLPALDVPPEDFRSHALVALAEPNIMELAVENSNGRTVLERNPAGEWVMRFDNQPYLLDRGYVEAIVEELRADGDEGAHRGVQRYLPLDPDEMQKYGFAGGVVKVEVKPEPGRAGVASTETLLVGAVAPPDLGFEGAWRVYNPRWGDEYAVSYLGIAAALCDAPWSLRSPQVLSIPSHRIIKVGFTTADGTREDFVKPSDQWLWWRRRAIDIDEPRINVVTDVFASLRAERWLGPGAVEGAGVGPDTDAHLVELRVDGDPPYDVRYWIGPLLPGGERLIREGDDGWLFRWRNPGRLDPVKQLEEYIEELRKK